MLNKLKYLKAYYERYIVPADDELIGKIIYTEQNKITRRKQIVIDVDNNSTKITTIDPYPADPLLFPGEIIENVLNFAPKNDEELYIFGGLIKLPVITNTLRPEYRQIIIRGTSISPINLLNGIKVDGVSATFNDIRLQKIEQNNLTINEVTGNVTLNNNTLVGTHTLTYKIIHKKEPSVFIEGIITIIITAK